MLSTIITHFLEHFLLSPACLVQTVQPKLYRTWPTSSPSRQSSPGSHSSSWIQLHLNNRWSQPFRLAYRIPSIPIHQSNTALNPGLCCHFTLLLSKHGGNRRTNDIKYLREAIQIKKLHIFRHCPKLHWPPPPHRHIWTKIYLDILIFSWPPLPLAYFGHTSWFILNIL